MRRVFWLWCSAGFLTVSLSAQAPQNPALPGAATASPIPDTNPFTSESDLRAGEALFQTHCTYCHGSFGEGGRGADLTTGVYRHGGRDPELYASVRNGIPGTEMAPVRVSDDDVWRMVGFVKRLGSRGLLEKAPGDPAAGRLVYQKSGCVSCHRVGSEGGNLGPDLTEIGRRRGLKFLTESLVKPESEIAVAYRAVQVVLKSGQTVTGLRLNRDDLSIQLRDTRDNLRSFLMQNVQDVRYDKPSLMPAYASMNSTDLENVIAYLNSLKGVP
jgi:putative heme-binding domain-containing protein